MALADELIERGLDGLRRRNSRLTPYSVQQIVKPTFVCGRGGDLHLAVRRDDEDRQVRELLRQVLRQLQRRLVRPLQVVDEDRERRETDCSA